MVFVIASFFNQNLQDLAEEEKRGGMPSLVWAKVFHLYYLCKCQGPDLEG